MAIWQKANNPTETFDDKQDVLPWDDGFSYDAVIAKFGKGNYNYMGTPAYIPPTNEDTVEGTEDDGMVHEPKSST